MFGKFKKNMFNDVSVSEEFRKKFEGKYLSCGCVFVDGILVISLIDITGKVYKTIRCEDETVYNYFLEVFNL